MVISAIPGVIERQFLEHLAVIDQVVQFIGRRHRLPADAIEELQSAVHLKMIDNDYEVLRKFEGRSSIRTYLTAVVQRTFSTASRRSGGAGVRAPAPGGPGRRASCSISC